MFRTFLSIVTVIMVAILPVSSNVAQQVDRGSDEASIVVEILTRELQRALEVDSVSDDLEKIVVLCANACEPKGAKGKKTKAAKQNMKNRDPNMPRANANASARGLERSTPALRGNKSGRGNMASVSAVSMLTCDSPLQCVDMIAREGLCRPGTVKCGLNGCDCEAN